MEYYLISFAALELLSVKVFEVGLLLILKF